LGFFLGAFATAAFAHAGEGGFVLLLPTGYYRVGGTLAVAASVALVAFAPNQFIARLTDVRIRLCRMPTLSPMRLSIASLIILALLVWQGVRGTQDPLQNPLPLTVWTLWWIGFTLVTALLGNTWQFINPWTGPYRLMRPSRKALFAYPDWLGHWPAVALFFAFAWFELVDIAPNNPERLAVTVSVYWLAMLAGMLLFGEEAWLGNAEPFSLFFRLISLLSPLRCEGNGRSCRLSLALPGAALVKAEPLPVSGIFFVLLTLAAVSFDGLSKTFLWLDLGGINPLEFPGRSAVIGQNTFGLLLVWAMLASAYTSALWLGWMLGGRLSQPDRLSGSLVLSLVPIALAYHFAHYLTALLINGQYGIAALLPIDLTVSMSLLTTYEGARLVWNLQSAAIVIGHILAVIWAHAIVLDRCGDRARRAEFPMASAMVMYTLFGLWLLSTPSAG
jgi:hypothetical protein